jgi:hypothetical protein
LLIIRRSTWLRTFSAAAAILSVDSPAERIVSLSAMRSFCTRSESSTISSLTQATMSSTRRSWPPSLFGSSTPSWA